MSVMTPENRRILWNSNNERSYEPGGVLYQPDEDENPNIISPRPADPWADAKLKGRLVHGSWQRKYEDRADQEASNWYDSKDNNAALSFQETHGMHPDQWLRNRYPNYQSPYGKFEDARSVPADAQESISSTSVLPASDVRSDKYTGNPNLQFATPGNTMTGPARASAEYIQMAPIEMITPIPGLEFASPLSLIPKTKSAKLVASMGKAFGVSPDLAKEVQAAYSGELEWFKYFDEEELGSLMLEHGDDWKRVATGISYARGNPKPKEGADLYIVSENPIETAWTGYSNRLEQPGLPSRVLGEDVGQPSNVFNWDWNRWTPKAQPGAVSMTEPVEGSKIVGEVGTTDDLIEAAEDLNKGPDVPTPSPASGLFDDADYERFLEFAEERGYREQYGDHALLEIYKNLTSKIEGGMSPDQAITEAVHDAMRLKGTPVGGKTVGGISPEGQLGTVGGINAFNKAGISLNHNDLANLQQAITYNRWHHYLSSDEMVDAYNTMRHGNQINFDDIFSRYHTNRNNKLPGWSQLLHTNPLEALRQGGYVDQYAEETINFARQFMDDGSIDWFLSGLVDNLGEIGNRPSDISAAISRYIDEGVGVRIGESDKFLDEVSKYIDYKSLSASDRLELDSRVIGNMKEGTNLETSIKMASEEVEFKEFMRDYSIGMGGMRESVLGMRSVVNEGEILSLPNVFSRNPHNIPVVNYQKIGDKPFSDANIYNYWEAYLKEVIPYKEWSNWVLTSSDAELNKTIQNLEMFYEAQRGGKPKPGLSSLEKKEGGILKY